MFITGGRDYKEEIKVLESTWNSSSWGKEKIFDSRGSKNTVIYGWIRSLSCALIEPPGRLGDGRRDSRNSTST